MPLPPQFAPLLSETVEKVKAVIGKVLPVDKKRTALEEAEYEDYDGEEGAFEREMALQCVFQQSADSCSQQLIKQFLSAMETLRVHRPRLILHGPIGMGQGYVGAAALHHLEGFHVQSLELATLMSDSTRVS